MSDQRGSSDVGGALFQVSGFGYGDGLGIRRAAGFAKRYGREGGLGEGRCRERGGVLALKDCWWGEM